MRACVRCAEALGLYKRFLAAALVHDSHTYVQDGPRMRRRTRGGGGARTSGAFAFGMHGLYVRARLKIQRGFAKAVLFLF
jgi:hypothetical protein